MGIIIREASEEDAEQIIAYLKIVGGETENLTFGESGFSITLLAHSHYLNITINLMKFHQQTRKPDFLCHRAKQECYVPLKRSLSHNGQSPDRKSTYG